MGKHESNRRVSVGCGCNSAIPAQAGDLCLWNGYSVGDSGESEILVDEQHVTDRRAALAVGDDVVIGVKLQRLQLNKHAD